MCWLVCGGDPALLPEIQARWAKEDAEEAAARARAPKGQKSKGIIPKQARVELTEEDDADSVPEIPTPIETTPEVSESEPEISESEPEISELVAADPIEPPRPVKKLKKVKAATEEDPKPVKKAKPPAEPKPVKKERPVAEPKTQALVLASSPKTRYAAYLRGFGQGASGRRRAETDRDYPDYVKGYEEGAAAREVASDAYADVVGHRPLILKVQDL